MKEYHKALSNAAIRVNGFLKKVYANINVEGLTLSPEELNSNPTMVVSSHRSHLDYMLLGAELNKAGLKNVRMAAGDNLTTIPILGPKFLSYGAFSVHRARSNSRQYIIDLCQKVMAMLENGDNILVFPEGGRSYYGKMMGMKNGILAANIFAQFNSPDRQYTYLPVTISYEKTPELEYFNKLNKGRRMRKGKSGFINKLKGSVYYNGADILAFLKFITAFRFGKDYGDVFVDIGKPIIINDIVDLHKNYSSKARNEFTAHKVSIQAISEVIGKELLQLYRITPLHVMSTILKKSGSCSRSGAESRVPEIIHSLEKKNRNCTMLSTLSEKEIVQKGVDKLCYFNVLSEVGNKIRIRNRSTVKYYAATIG
jgi:1-acyl-sn-glycerol-3-phosphate acyltransferase